MPDPPPKAPFRPECILVVDDDPMILDFLTAMLEKQGFLVLPAENGEEALALAAALPASAIDLLITDLDLPGVAGPELAARLRATRPEIKIIVASGRSAAETAEACREIPGLVYLAKPFAMRALIEAIQALSKPS